MPNHTILQNLVKLDTKQNEQSTHAAEPHLWGIHRIKRIKAASHYAKLPHLVSLLLVGTLLLSCSPSEEKTDGKRKVGYPSLGTGRPTVAADPVEKTGITICIDPGHGFDDVGCSSPYLTDDREEKDLTLLYANALKSALENKGYTVLLTHDGTSFPQSYNFNNNNIFSVDERAAYVNTLDIDYFVSLHCDTFDEDASVGGIRVYYYDSETKTATNSDAIANSIGAYLAKKFPDAKTPSVHDNQPYLVLRDTTMAASLIEIGFISNETDAANLQTETWQADFVAGVAEGIDSYFTLYQ